VIKRCRDSCLWFLNAFGKIKHPSAGMLPFTPFKYQQRAIQSFRENKLNIFRKCRQAGISKISGAFALWFAMFNNYKTILIVSRKNDDAMSFLREHIVFLYENLPEWMQELWKPIKLNEHEIIFPNNSKITSLTSHPEVLRSHASSLNIIDEAAFIQGMDVMWAAGWPTLQHGGRVICISTTAGVGGWYWSTWTDAEQRINGWNPISINWWDMDWAIEYKDQLSNDFKRIAPTDNLVNCDNQLIDVSQFGRLKLDPMKYGPKWSPWLEDQYRALQEQGEGWKFEQEILAHFVGSGGTVLDKSVLSYMGDCVQKPDEKVKGIQVYVNPASNEEEDMDFEFDSEDEGFWIWKKPVLTIPERRRSGILLNPTIPAHSYVMGVDMATGKGRDYSAIEIFDVDTREQVAEFMARVLPREFVKYIDRIGRYFNCALAVVERNNGGDIIIDQLRYDIQYPRLWRRKDLNDKPTPGGASRKRQKAMKVAAYGFATTGSSKASLNKLLMDHFRTNGEEGYTIYSERLYKQFQTYVRKRDRMGRDTMRTEAEEGSGNHDDLVIATALAMVGLADAGFSDSSGLMPVNGGLDFKSPLGSIIQKDVSKAALQKSILESGMGVMMPIALAPTDFPDIAASRAIDAFTLQLGAIPISQGRPVITPPKYFKRDE